jgi:peroxiredoxin
MFCREHAAQLRDAYSDITAAGADVVAVGTGNTMYAKAFVDDEKVPFAVLIDEDGHAAEAASVKGGAKMLVTLLTPSVVSASRRARKEGHRQHKTGSRSTQLGATFVMAPGDKVLYSHLDGDVGDHAPLADVMAALHKK